MKKNIFLILIIISFLVSASGCSLPVKVTQKPIKQKLLNEDIQNTVIYFDEDTIVEIKDNDNKLLSTITLPKGIYTPHSIFDDGEYIRYVAPKYIHIDHHTISNFFLKGEFFGGITIDNKSPGKIHWIWWFTSQGALGARPEPTISYKILKKKYPTKYSSINN